MLSLMLREQREESSCRTSLERRPLAEIPVGREVWEVRLLVRVRRQASNSFYCTADERVLGVLKLSEGILTDNLEHVEACGVTMGH